MANLQRKSSKKCKSANQREEDKRKVVNFTLNDKNMDDETVHHVSNGNIIGKSHNRTHRRNNHTNSASWRIKTIDREVTNLRHSDNNCLSESMGQFNNNTSSEDEFVNRRYDSVMKGDVSSCSSNNTGKLSEIDMNTKHLDILNRYMKKRNGHATNSTPIDRDNENRDNGFINGVNRSTTLSEMPGDNAVPRTREGKHSIRNCRSAVVSLKQFGLENEIDIRYIPPMKYSKPQRRFNMDGWRKRVVARKQSAKSTKSGKSDKITESGNSDTDAVHDNDSDLQINGNHVIRVESEQRMSHEGSELTLDVSHNHQQDTMEQNQNTTGNDNGTAYSYNEDIEDEMLPPADKPVYDAYGSSTALILLNNRNNKKSRLWRMNTHTNRGSLINPARHTQSAVPCHGRCRTNSIEKSGPIKPIIKFQPERPQSERIGDRLYDGRNSVNPHRHRACSVKHDVSFTSLDSSDDSRKDDCPSVKNRWLKIYSHPHIRREPTGLNKNVPNLRDMIKSPAWSSNKTGTNKLTKTM